MKRGRNHMCHFRHDRNNRYEYSEHKSRNEET